MVLSILFVDSQVENYESLLVDLTEDVEVFLLNAEEDGILQMADFLKGRSNLDSIHVISHGSYGALALGSSLLSGDNLSDYEEALGEIGASLSEQGDILLYGCNVAGGDKGLRFVDSLAQYTGADIAASDDLTGLDGDWDLEITKGKIEASLKINEVAQNQYTGALVTTTNPLDALLLINNGDLSARWNYPDSIGTLLTSPGGTGNPVEISYSFLTSVPGYFSTTGFAQFNATEQQATNDILQSISNIANLTFTPVSGVGSMTFAMNTQSGSSGYAYYPSFSTSYSNNIITGTSVSDLSGDVWLNSSIAWTAEDFNPSGSGYHTLMHEIGHALGLKHPFSGDYTLETSFDSKKYTVMSYTEHPNSLYRTVTETPTGYSWSYDYINSDTLMPFDILALQHLYGANTSYNTGDDLYTFDTDRPFIKTIWDGGGSDTISITNFTLGSTIDLREGHYSSINIPSDPLPLGQIDPNTNIYDGTDNLAIAYGVTIENAIGGSGDDSLIGNNADNTLTGGSGNDILDGGVGNDTLVGGTGNDTYLFGMGDGKDSIIDYDTTLGNVDTIQLDAGIATTDLNITRDVNHLYLNISGTEDTLFITNWFTDNANIIEQIIFSDTTVWDAATLVAQISNNSAPTGVVTISGSIAQGSTLNASHTLADADGLGTISYQWQADGVDIGTGSSYLLTQSDVGKSIRVTASYTDQQGTDESVSSAATVVVANFNDPITLIYYDEEAFNFQQNQILQQLSGVVVSSSEHRITFSETLSGNAYWVQLEGTFISKNPAITNEIRGSIHSLTLYRSISSDTPLLTINFVNEIEVQNVLNNPYALLVSNDLKVVIDQQITQNNMVVSGIGDDIIIGDSGNDSIKGGGGNDFIDGDMGIDTVVYSNSPYDYLIFINSDNQYIVNDLSLNTGDDGRDILENIEFIEFSTGILPVEQVITQLEIIDDDTNYWNSKIGLPNGEIISDIEAQLFRTYFGAMQRTPDDDGYAWWLNEIHEGRYDLKTMATGFIWSQEFLGYVDAPDGNSIQNDTFLTHMYEGVFGRVADADGYNWWLNQLETGGYSQADVLVNMTQSNEYVELTLAGVVDYLY